MFLHKLAKQFILFSFCCFYNSFRKLIHVKNWSNWLDAQCKWFVIFHYKKNMCVSLSKKILFPLLTLILISICKKIVNEMMYTFHANSFIFMGINLVNIEQIRKTYNPPTELWTSLIQENITQSFQSPYDITFQTLKLWKVNDLVRLRKFKIYWFSQNFWCTRIKRNWR